MNHTYVGSPYKWLTLTSARTLFTLPRTVASLQTFSSPSRHLKLPAYTISNSFGFMEPLDVVRRYLDPASIYERLS